MHTLEEALPVACAVGARAAEQPVHLVGAHHRSGLVVHLPAAHVSERERLLQEPPLLRERLLEALALGQVGLDGNVVMHAAVRIADRLDVECDPQLAAVLGVVEHLHAGHRLASLQCLAHSCHHLGVGAGAVQERRGPPAAHFIERPSGDARVGVVDPLDAALGIGDHDHVGHMLDDELEGAQVVPGNGGRRGRYSRHGTHAEAENSRRNPWLHPDPFFANP